jgi:hypothetical protein
VPPAVGIKLVNDLPGEHGFTGTGRCFQNESFVAGGYRRKVIDNFLLPIPELHQNPNK